MVGVDKANVPVNVEHLITRGTNIWKTLLSTEVMETKPSCSRVANFSAGLLFGAFYAFCLIDENWLLKSTPCSCLHMKLLLKTTKAKSCCFSLS